MNESQPQRIRPGAPIVAFLGAFLIVALLVLLMQSYTREPSIAAARAAERMKNLADFNAANAPLLEKYDWQDQAKGFVRVPVDRAVELFLQQSKDPVAARSNLMARAAKAFAPAPVAPPPKNMYE